MTPAELAALRALPDDVLVPVRMIRPLLATADGAAETSIGLTVEQVVERTGRAASTVRTWCAEGRLHGARRLRGREWRIPATALAALLEGETPSAPGAQRLPTPRGGLSAWREAK